MSVSCSRNNILVDRDRGRRQLANLNAAIANGWALDSPPGAPKLL